MVPCCSGGRTFHGQKNKQVKEKIQPPPSDSFLLWKRQSAQEQLQQPGKSQRGGVQSIPTLKCRSAPAWDSPGIPRPPRPMDAALKSRAEGRKHSMDISLSSKRSWSTAGYHPALAGFGKMLQLYTWLTYYSSCSQMLSVVSPSSTNLAYPRWKYCEESLW